MLGPGRRRRARWGLSLKKVNISMSEKTLQNAMEIGPVLAQVVGHCIDYKGDKPGSNFKLSKQPSARLRKNVHITDTHFEIASSQGKSISGYISDCINYYHLMEIEGDFL